MEVGRRWIGGRGIICRAAQILPAQDDMPNSQRARRTFIPVHSAGAHLIGRPPQESRNVVISLLNRS
jgi:hypothetical protein